MTLCTYHLVVIFVGSILTLGDLNFVYKNLIKAAGDWVDLGLDLGLDPGTLKDIKDDYHRNKDCLREMIAARLKTGPLSYSDICQSLRSPTVDRNDVAEAIEKACTGMNSHEANLDQHFYAVYRILKPCRNVTKICRTIVRLLAI